MLPACVHRTRVRMPCTQHAAQNTPVACTHHGACARRVRTAGACRAAGSGGVGERAPTEHVMQPGGVWLEGVGRREASVAVERGVGLWEVALPQVEPPRRVVARRLVSPRVELGRLRPSDVRVTRGELPLGLGGQPATHGVAASHTSRRAAASGHRTGGCSAAAHRLPAHLQNALASFHETWTTGWLSRSLMPEPGPSGDRQLAPGTAIQWEASLTDELVTALRGT